MSTLNIFIDESGDMGKSDNSELYVVSLVLHDQENEIQKEVKMYTNLLDEIGQKPTIHIANVVNNNNEAKTFSDIEERRSYYNKMKVISNRLKVSQKTFIIEKKFCNTLGNVLQKLIKEVQKFVNDNDEFFCTFEEINIYYDKGQPTLNAIIMSAFMKYNPKYPKFDIKDKLLSHVADFYTFQEKLLFQFQSRNYSVSTRQKKFFELNKDTSNKFFLNLKKDLHKKRI